MKVKPIGCTAQDISPLIAQRPLLSGGISLGDDIGLHGIDLNSMSDSTQISYEVSFAFAYVVD